MPLVHGAIYEETGAGRPNWDYWDVRDEWDGDELDGWDARDGWDRGRTGMDEMRNTG